jgi:MYXO-CTERM domain-containing protein
VDVRLAERVAATDLTHVGETSLMGWWRQDDNTVELAGPGDDGTWSVLDVVPDAAGAYLSAGDDSHALLVFYRSLEFYGSESYSLHTSVVSVQEPLGGAGQGGGGQGGADTGGDTVGAGEGGLHETGGVGAAMAAGASSLAGGAESSGDADAGEPISGTSPPRTSSGCGCGVAGQSDSHGALLLSGMLAALAFRRRDISRRR